MRRPIPRFLALTLTAAALAAAGGCYKHVVGAKGPGADRYELHEPSIGEDESVWSTPRPRPKDDSYGLRQPNDVPGQTRPASQDD
jgi:hypothetical protein